MKGNKMASRQYYVYKYVSQDKRVVYIGKSESIHLRLKQHASFQGVDKKFKKYKDAKIFVHECASKHEMDALEVILIEKYKPELNVSAKSEQLLTFEFNDSMKWVDYESIKLQNKTAAKATVRKINSDGKTIKSRKGISDFCELIRNWHTLYYFANWLMEQKDDDTRTTVEIDLNNYEEVSKWTWEFPETCNEINLKNVLSCCHPHLNLPSGFRWLVVQETRVDKKIWLDLYSPVNALKHALPLISESLRYIMEKILAYKDIDAEFVRKSKVDDFCDIFKKIRYGITFPTVLDPISKEEMSYYDEYIEQNYVTKHESPKLDFNKEEVEKAFMDMLLGCNREERCWMVGGAYWNALNVYNEEDILMTIAS